MGQCWEGNNMDPHGVELVTFDVHPANASSLDHP